MDEEAQKVLVEKLLAATVRIEVAVGKIESVNTAQDIRLKAGDARFEAIESAIDLIKTQIGLIKIDLGHVRGEANKAFNESFAANVAWGKAPCRGPQAKPGCPENIEDPILPRPEQLIRPPMLLRTVKPKLDLLSKEASWGIAIGALVTLVFMVAFMYFLPHFRPR